MKTFIIALLLIAAAIQPKSPQVISVTLLSGERERYSWTDAFDTTYFGEVSVLYCSFTYCQVQVRQLVGGEWIIPYDPFPLTGVFAETRGIPRLVYLSDIDAVYVSSPEKQELLELYLPNLSK